MMNRRDFLKGCATFTALAATRGFGITNLAFADSTPARPQRDPNTPPPNGRDLLIFVFVRGGMDGLNIVVPHNASAKDRASYYNSLRPTLNIAAPNSSAARKAIDLNGKFAFHPDCARGATGVNVPNKGSFDTGGLYELYRRGDLAVVTACGSLDITGSHFDTELYVDMGGKAQGNGWLSRYLQTVNTDANALVVSPQSSVSPSLGGWYGSSAIPNAQSYGPSWRLWNEYNDAQYKKIDIAGGQRALLEPMFNRGADFVEAQGRAALTTFDMLKPVLDQDYTPAANYLGDDPSKKNPTQAERNEANAERAMVPDYGHFANSMKTIARLAKASIANPLRVACVDVGGGWDTHDNEGTLDWNGNARFPRLLTNLSTNLKAFCDDMNADPNWVGRYTIAVVSEFGRVLYQNDSGGCDHGAGNNMFIIGSGGGTAKASVNGGQVLGNWPGLQTLGFNDGLQITTDYRQVLADILQNRMKVTKDQINQTIFPNMNFSTGLGVTKPATATNQTTQNTPLGNQIFIPQVSQ